MAESPPVETITIRVVGDVKDGVQAIDKVTAALGNLQNKGSSKSLSGLSDKIRGIVDAAKSVDSESANRLEKLASAMATLKQNAVINFGKTPERLAKLAEAAGNLTGFNFDKLRELAEILHDFRGLPNINIPRMAGQSSYRSRTSGVGRTKQTFADEKVASKTVEDATQKVNEATGVFARFRASITNAKNSFVDFGKRVSKDATVVKDALVKEGKAWAIGSGTGMEALAGVDPKLAIIIGLATKAAKAISSVAKAMWNVTKSVVTFPFKVVGNFLSKITNGIGNLIKMAKKRILYRLLNGLISAVTKGFSEGVQAVFEYSNAFNGRLAQSLDTIATAFLYFKNSVGAAAAPLINALAPAIDFVVDRAVDLLNVLNQVFAVLTGSSTWTKAIKVPINYEDAANKATKAAKKLKKSVLGIDELNQLQDNSSGAGSGSGSALDYTKMFEEQTVTSAVAKWFGDLKQAFLDGDYEGLANQVGSKLNSMIQKAKDLIKWGTVKEKFQAKVKEWAAVFNGLNAKIDWKNLGDLVITGVQTVLNGIKTVLDEFDISGTGTSFANFLNGIFGNTTAWEDIGKTINTGIQTALDWVINFLDTLDFKQAGEAVGTAVKQIDKGGSAAKIGSIFKKIFTGGLEFLKAFIESSGIKPILQKIWNAFVGALSVFLLTVPGIGPFLSTIVRTWMVPVESTFEKKGKSAASKFASGAKTKWETDAQGRKITSGFKTLLDNGLDETIASKRGRLAAGNVIGGLTSKLGDAPSKSTLQKVTDWLKGIFTGDKAEARGGALVRGIGVGVSTGLDNWSAPSKLDIKVGTWLNSIFPTTKASDKGVSLGEWVYNGLVKIFDKTDDKKQKGKLATWLDGIFKKDKAENKGKELGGAVVNNVKSGVDAAAEEQKKKGGLGEWLKNLFPSANAVSVGKSLGDGMIDGIKQKLNDTKIDLSIGGTNGSGANLTATLKAGVRTSAKAEGGFVKTGEAFIAREAGPELVGRIGNRTAVANNDQIVDGVAQGVYEANAEQNALLREQNNLLRQILSKEGGGTPLTADAIMNTMNRWNRRVGATA